MTIQDHMDKVWAQIWDLDNRIKELETREAPIIAARYKTSTAHSIASGSETRVNFDTQDYDPRAAVTTGASWVFTAPIGGYYAFKVTVQLTGVATWAPGEYMSLYARVNGTIMSLFDYFDNLSAGVNHQMTLSGGDCLHLDAADTLAFYVYQNSGGAINLRSGNDYYNHAAIWKVSS